MKKPRKLRHEAAARHQKKREKRQRVVFARIQKRLRERHQRRQPTDE